MPKTQNVSLGSWLGRAPGGSPAWNLTWGWLKTLKIVVFNCFQWFLKTWLSCNGKRERLESVQHDKRRPSGESGREMQEQERQHPEEQQSESGESMPSLETASRNDRVVPCSRAARARRRFKLGAFPAHPSGRKVLGISRNGKDRL